MFNSGFRGKRAKDGEGTVGQQTQYIQAKSPQPGISSWTISGSDDLALDPAGGQTVLVNGGGFASGCAVTVDGATISPVTVVSPTQISFTSPAKSGGSYTLIVYNSSGGAAILVPGLTYSSIPTFNTSAGSLGDYYETTAISETLVASSDSSMTYELASGSLPDGSTLYANGVITGTAPVDSSSTTYSFSVKATDEENQDVTRSFTLTINTDVVTWVTPSSGTTVFLENTYSQSLTATDAAGYAVSYTANTLPAGLTLSSGTISGTVTEEGTTTTLLTATAATTGRSATNTITWVVSLNDMYFKYTTLLLTASNSLQSKNFVSDGSINNSQLSVVGDTKPSNFNPFQFGYYSVYFGANGQYLTGSHGWLNVSNVATAWTFECWVYPITAGCIFAIGSGGSYGNSIYIDWGSTANKFRIAQGSGSSNPVSLNSTGTYPANNWYHLAITRTAAGVNTIYVNGVADGTVTYTAGGFASGSTFVVNGSYDNNGLGANGSAKYISNLRFTINQSLYSANFTPSTSPTVHAQNTMLLLCQSYRFVDTSQWGHAVTVGSTPNISRNNPFANQYQITSPTASYSYYFNGSSFLTVPSSSILQLGMTWTVECWIYPLSSGKQQIFVVGGTYLYIESVSGFNISKWSNGSNSNNYGGYLVVNSWNHVAWQCDSDGVLRGFINGIAALASSGYSVNTLSDATIGAYTGTVNPYSGYISNLRVLKGTALYNTAGFNPPTEPLTAITNTVLLTCQSSTIIDNSTSAFSLTQSGTVTSVPFYPVRYTGVSSTPLATTLGSAYFDGTGDYVVGSATGAASADFTIEFWMNTATSNSTASRMLGNISGSWGTGRWVFGPNNGSGKVQFQVYNYNTSSAMMVSTTTVNATAAWHHVAVSRTGSTWKLFVNGVQEATVTSSVALDSGSILPFVVGSSGISSELYTGYISNVRYIKGTALYTSNFVPQFTSPLTNVTNTQLLTLQTNVSHNNSTFIDNSRENNIITRVNNITNGTFSPYGDNWSVYVDGSSNIQSTDYSNFILPGDFTIELWFYSTANAGAQLINFAGGLNIAWASYELKFWGTTINFAASSANTGYDIGSESGSTGQIGGTVTQNRWYHVAVTRSGNVYRGFLDGVLGYTQTIALTPYAPTSRGLTIGSNYQTTWGVAANVYDRFTGYISNVRIIKGTALYTANFTPSTSPLQATPGTILLAAQTSRMTKDNGPLNSTFTVGAGSPAAQKFSPFGTVTVPKYYSTYFNGTSDYIQTATSTALDLPGDFTIECWIFPTALTSNRIIAERWAGSTGWELYWRSTGTSLTFYVNTTVIMQDPSASTISALNTWYHVAVTRSGTTAYMFVNGTQVQTVTGFSTSLASSLPLTIGNQYSTSTNYFSGYISNFRIVKGTALYTSTFTPSTTPLTAIANTVLLTCQDSTFKDNSTNNVTITAGTTSVKPLQFSPFTATASLTTNYSPTTFGGSFYFDGVDDYLTLPSSIQYNLIGDFTFEAWIYPTATMANAWSLFDARVNGATAAPWSVGLAISSGYKLDFWTGTSYTGTKTINLNEWTHVVWTRNGSTLRSYVNGVVDYNNASYGTADISPGTSTAWVGTKDNGLAGYDTQGYISDMRLTRGVCLYKNNFYPGTAPLTATTTLGTSSYNSTLLLNGTSSGVIDATRTVDFETVADAKVTNFSPYNGAHYGLNLSTSSSTLGFTQPALGNVFTIEMWIFPTAVEENNFMYMGISSGPIIGYNSTTFSAAHQGTWTVAASTNPALGAWSHVALVREGTGSNQFKLYLNGTLVGTGTDATAFGSQSAVIGGNANASYTGYIHSLRVVNNQALYTGSFTPSTTTLTTSAVGSTGAGAAASLTGDVVLLAAQAKTFKDNSPSQRTLTPSGSPSVITQNPFQVNTGLSYYFDGTGDYLTTNNFSNPSLVFGTGNFTIEYWVYMTDSSDRGHLQISSTSGGLVASAAGNIYISHGSYTGKWQISVNGSGSGSAVGVGTTLNEWHHVALVRNNGTLYFYVDGTSIYSAADTYNYTGSYIAVGGYWGTGYLLIGYIADLRITKGIARYTTTFTPPTDPVKLN